ncbi:hypothetical protein [Alcanivorax sp. 1008]|uniref:hypothetical protein n=1 Tax=Alcanivorax sp. 1008 TaxID=2816853 RepID=UPI001DA6E944|nr:hypothetical protein [Alcanivorax sp. 1008]MCC1495598.1 hypothetical protein [Alcanivorax sp. 1008]
MNQPIELTPSRWPWLLWGLAGLLVFTALLLSGLSLTGQVAASLLLLCVGLLEWRQQRRVRSLQFSTQIICCVLRGGEKLQARWPLPGMANRYWVSFGLPARVGGRVWLTVYHDQLSAADFRHLRVMMGR